ncbi:hypothetical protein ACRE_081220 [Hapsidospora chrysogenum ATCC 11550]|uniref:Uncharacterized protein n=1 Tax=Hapsidospora chrysogenum (strain ATCC 11550 / CBS 779.69 / DSM 880 / IAM 14645 / JCM 23072 / IMI 49137) TaxID=857340 RepID=A0A086SVN8_HAPC1|nr:hypothetical protein ACRE_081220 [Hapsidospora chrysogenum ATCC 11550]
MGVPVWCLAPEQKNGNIQRTSERGPIVSKWRQCPSGGLGLDQIKVLGGRFGRLTGFQALQALQLPL